MKATSSSHRCLRLTRPSSSDRSQLASRQALALSVEAAIPTKDSMDAILIKAVRDARGLAIEAAIYEKDVVDAIIGKAYREGQVSQEPGKIII